MKTRAVKKQLTVATIIFLVREVDEKRTSRVSRRAKLRMQLQDKLANSFIQQRFYSLLINGKLI